MDKQGLKPQTLISSGSGLQKAIQRSVQFRGRGAALKTIVFYQRYLSPLKGFHCAHRRLHGGLSCSEYVRQTIAAQGLRRSFPLCRERFEACRLSHETLKTLHQQKIQKKAQTQRLQQQRLQKTWLSGQSLEEVVLRGTLSQDPVQPTEPEEGSDQENLDPGPPAETLTQGEYYTDPDLNPPLPLPHPLASCCVCGAIDLCCGGPSSLGGMGCGDPLEGCSCCWDGCNLSACSCWF